MKNQARILFTKHGSIEPDKNGVFNYEQLRPILSTFDCIICEHKRLFWRLIGHTAGIYKSSSGQLMVFESTSLNKWTGISGVQLNPLGTWLMHYPGKVFIRRIQYQFERRVFKEKLQKADGFIRKYRGTSYPDISTRKGRWYLIKSAWDSVIFEEASTNKDTEDWIFCTDLYVRWLKFCDITIKDITTSEFEPDDTYPGEKLDQVVSHGVSFGSQLIRIK